MGDFAEQEASGEGRGKDLELSRYEAGLLSQPRDWHIDFPEAALRSFLERK